MSKTVDKAIRHKAIADAFEASIGGLALERGFSVVQEWLQLFYALQLRAMQCQASQLPAVDMNS